MPRDTDYSKEITVYVHFTLGQLLPVLESPRLFRERDSDAISLFLRERERGKYLFFCLREKRETLLLFYERERDANFFGRPTSRRRPLRCASRVARPQRPALAA